MHTIHYEQAYMWLSKLYHRTCDTLYECDWHVTRYACYDRACFLSLACFGRPIFIDIIRISGRSTRYGCTFADD